MVPICCIYITIQDLAELFFRQSTNYMVYSVYYTQCYKVITYNIWVEKNATCKKAEQISL